MMLRLIAAAALTALAFPAAAQPAPDATLRSTPETVVWGYITSGVAPVLRIKSGQTVRIDTVSHQGLLSKDDPVAFFGKAGIPADQVLADAVEIYRKAARPKGASAHVLTGPIHVEEARTGDLLEVRVVDLAYRVPYGVNNTGPGTGTLPDLVKEPTPKIIKFDLARRVALFAPGIEVPLQPFLGIMAVAPAPDLGLVSSRPPGRYGGNMDFKRLTIGATLYLPVLNDGALFFTGDSHAVQGDGEIDGTAIEASLTATLQFIVRKEGGRALRWPRAEDAENYYVMGMDLVLDEAMKQASAEAVLFLGEKAGLSPADAYALASIAVDFHVGEAVDAVQMIYGVIPKALFKEKPEYWYRR